MKIFYNSWVANHLLPKGYKAITLFSMIFFKKSKDEIKPKDLNHEMIHSFQQMDCFFLGIFISFILTFFPVGLYIIIPLPFVLFYIFYGLEYVIALPFNKLTNSAYHTISFEEEAYENEENPLYLNFRKPFTWVKYLGKVRNKK